MFVQAIKRGHEYGCVYVSVTIKQISSTQLLVCVMEVRAMEEAPRDVCVCVCL